MRDDNNCDKTNWSYPCFYVNMYRYKLSSPVFNCSHILVKNHITRRYNTVRNFSTMTKNLVSTLTNILGIEIEENFWRTKKHIIPNDIYIQGLPSLNVAILPSCRGPQIKENSVIFFCKLANFFCKFFCNILEYF